MKATTLHLAAIATAVTLAATAPAFAQRHHHGGNNAAGAAAIGLLGGLALGAALAPQPAPPPPAVYYTPAPVYAGPSPHVDWCTRNTPGYNAYDNTYQGYYAGERIVCRSPYGG